MKLYIKHMVDVRCITAVNDELAKLRLHFVVGMGMAEIVENITHQQREQIRIGLLQWGLELIDDKKAMLVEKTKSIILEMLHEPKAFQKTNFSDYLTSKLNYDYTYLATLFSEIHQTTIEKFIILQKIEQAKALIMENKLNLTEIAWQMNYSSIAHLSNQFKKITGVSPSQFKKENARTKTNQKPK